MIFEFVRKLLCPFDEIVKLVPPTGRILDIGCGHGMLCQMLAKESSQREVLGIDPSFEKIKLAKSKKKYGNLRFRKAYLEDLNEKFDCIVVMDVTYLFNNEEKLAFFKEIKKRLNKNGVLILKTVSTEPKILYKLLLLEETIMVKILKYTYADKREVYISDRRTYKNILKKAGFALFKEFVFQSIFPYRHPTFVAKKI